MKKLEQIREKAAEAYGDYIDQLGKAVCLGWAAKVKSGEFGEAELQAHQKANQFYGQHLGLCEAIKILEVSDEGD